MNPVTQDNSAARGLPGLPGLPGLVVNPGEAGRKLLSFLSLHLENMPGCNASALQKWIRSGQVRVNSRRSKPFARLEAGDLVRLPPFALPYLKQQNPEQIPLHPGLELPAPQLSQLSKLPRSAREFSGGSPDSANFYDNGPEDFPASGNLFQAAPGLPAPPATIVAVEEDLLVIHKPAGLAVQPGSAQTDSLSERLAAHFKGALFIPAPAHRLDRAASGLLLCGRSQIAQQKLHALLAEGASEVTSKNGENGGDANAPGSARGEAKNVGRVYLAWVSGRLDLPPDTLLEDYLVKSWDSESQREIMTVSPGRNRSTPGPDGPDDPDPGRSTDSKLARSLGRTLFIDKMPSKITRQTHGRAAERTERSLLKITLLSGRKHQIRVQLAARGHPIIGDPKYGGPAYPRLLLHACGISLPDGRRFALPPDWPAAWNVEDINLLDPEE